LTDEVEFFAAGGFGFLMFLMRVKSDLTASSFGLRSSTRKSGSWCSSRFSCASHFVLIHERVVLMSFCASFS
jgi:hypothetical protein